MPEKLKGGVACLCCARPLSKWQFCFINRQAIGFIRSLLYMAPLGKREKYQKEWFFNKKIGPKSYNHYILVFWVYGFAIFRLVLKAENN